MDDITPDQRLFLTERAAKTREHWQKCADAIRAHSQPIRAELEELRKIDEQLPFAVLTILIEHELR